MGFIGVNGMVAMQTGLCGWWWCGCYADSGFGGDGLVAMQMRLFRW
jgi:hypothetical protein